MPNTKRQHFVPSVYLKAWETEVVTDKEPNKPISGIYVYEGNESVGHGKTRDSVLWKPHLYTVGFCYSYIVKSCPKIYKDFVDQIYEILRVKRNPPVYGKYGYSVIKTKGSIRKHLLEIEDWEYFYDNNHPAKKKAIINDIESINSYIIEDGLDQVFETNWETTLNNFLREMRSDESGQIGKSERIIKQETAENVLAFLFMMLCRNPSFDGMGIYTWVSEDLLKATFTDSDACIDQLMNGFWYTELYRMLYRGKGGHFHSFMSDAIKRCQMILFETYDDAGTFITSDNPAFRNKSTVIECKNEDGFIFPITPHHLLFMGRGPEGCNVVDYRYANKDTVRHYNNLIYRHRINITISSEKTHQ